MNIFDIIMIISFIGAVYYFYKYIMEQDIMKLPIKNKGGNMGNLVDQEACGWKVYGRFAWGVGIYPYDGVDFLNRHGIGFQLHLFFYAVTVTYWFK
jgi:hypothetical protein